MRRSRKPILIASRQSPLARRQAEMVGEALGRLHPGIRIAYHWIESEGDQQTDAPLTAAGGKGLFARAVDRAVLQGEADLAVHSLKDLPAEESPGLQIAAVPRRSDVRDCLVSRAGAESLDALPQSAVVGTSSPRRAAQLRRLRPDLRVLSIRGNVETRLQKVLDPKGEPLYDATLLAAAGLIRLGLREHRRVKLSVDQVMPAGCQGALAIRCRGDDHVTLTRCLPLNDPASATAAHAERSLIAALGGDCHSPIAVLAEPVPPPTGEAKRNADAHWFRLRARVLSSDGSRCLSFDERVRTRELRRLVKRATSELLAQGAREVLRSAQPIPAPPRPQPSAARPLDPAKVG